MTKAGVIGTGYWGKKHVEEYNKLGVALKIADLNRDTLEVLKKKYGCETVTDYHDLLNDPEITSISICTPNGSHYKICKEALLAGKNVLVEKPLALKVSEAKELVAIARKVKRTLVVGHVFRFNNAVLKVKEMLDGGDFGEIYLLKLKWTNLEPPYSDRDVIFDLAPHPFDIINFLFNRDPDEVSAVGNEYRRSKGAEAAFVNCRLGKTIINIELSWLTPIKERTLMIVGSRKAVHADLLSQKTTEYENGSVRDLGVQQNNTIRAELESFLKNSQNNTESIASGRIGIKTIRMLEIVERSLEKKRTLKFKIKL